MQGWGHVFLDADLPAHDPARDSMSERMLAGSADRELIVVGAYTPTQGRANGIGLLEYDPGSGGRRLGTVAVCDSPSFLAHHPHLDVVYSVHEFTATVQANRRGSERGAFQPQGAAWPAGAAVCHVAVDPAGTMLVVNCWGDGQVISYGLNEEGEIVSRFVAEPAAQHPEPGSDAVQSRAHAALFVPDGRVLTTDLGLDRVRVWRRDADAELVLDHEVAVEPGDGPRHLVLHPSGLVYVVGEYTVEVSVLAADSDGHFAVIARTQALPSGTSEGDTASEISLNAAATRLYVAVRGSDRIATLAVSPDGRTIEAIGETWCGGIWPRHHLLHEDAEHGSHLHVANERSDTVATLAIDAETGLPGEVLHTTPTPSPSCLLGLPELV